MRAFLQEYPFVRPSQAYAVFRALAHVKEGIEWARPKVLDGQGGLCMIQAEKFDTATFETCTTELILPVSPQQELSVSDVCTGGRKLIAMVGLKNTRNKKTTNKNTLIRDAPKFNCSWPCDFSEVEFYQGRGTGILYTYI
eukprot:GEMP01094298.1.p1 GENE.GEMP01094298.1~~GEMP01094298.1.p1  ORF type:complete len:140 (+),score=22.20 GEMP01094298.1:281-700(+)